MNPRVLIGFADALAGIESAWSLLDDGFEVYAFARRGRRPALAHSRKIRMLDITAPEEDADRCAEEFAAAVGRLSPAVVLPLDDHAVWLCDHALDAVLDTATVAGPTGKLALLALDKREQLRLAAAAGFTIFESVDPAVAFPPGGGPWMVKPALAVERRGGKLHRPVGRIAVTAEQARAIGRAIGGPAMAQPFIMGTGEGVFGLATAQGVTAWSAHRRIRMMNPRGSGSSACRSIPVAADLVEPVRAMITSCDWRGIFMIEILRDAQGQPWFMELNGRAWGSMALACRRGFSYPSWAVRAALDPAFAPPEPLAAPHMTARHLGREIVHVGAVMARGGAPRRTTLRDVLVPRSGECWYNWRRGEMGVFVADTWATVRAQIPAGKR